MATARLPALTQLLARLLSLVPHVVAPRSQHLDLAIMTRSMLVL